jgi:hypothetical protein
VVRSSEFSVSVFQELLWQCIADEDRSRQVDRVLSHDDSLLRELADLRGRLASTNSSLPPRPSSSRSTSANHSFRSGSRPGRASGLPGTASNPSTSSFTSTTVVARTQQGVCFVCGSTTQFSYVSDSTASVDAQSQTAPSPTCAIEGWDCAVPKLLRRVFSYGVVGQLSITMDPYSFKAIVPVAQWVSPPPASFQAMTLVSTLSLAMRMRQQFSKAASCVAMSIIRARP